MSTDLERAKARLTGDTTCALCKENRLYETQKRGVAPLLEWIENGVDLQGFSAADKVVGKAAAFLYVIMGVKSVYANVISEPALKTLQRFHVQTEYAQIVPSIRNRTNTGFCPMETAVWEIDEPILAYNILKEKTSV
jgi:hypothetical protein